ncbi:MAG TPA: hypothetical protein VK442_05695 [Xanthobacteraceae bacterium]|nr:hypothetical protein [Xanthobacteraceae bacterium]
MLAYIFWHRPKPDLDPARYEAGLIRFQQVLTSEPPPGFLGAASFAIAPVPWLSDRPGYEDWYFVEASWALDPLNGFAIAGARQAPHDDVAAQAEEGHGGLYAHAGGEAVTAPQSTITWLTRPRGIQWQPPLAAVRAQCREANVWRRQMVLGVASEFAVETPGDIDLEAPAGWQALRVKRVRLPRAAA